VKLWLDAQLAPALALWITESLGISAVSVRDLGLRDAIDRDIFAAARDAKATVLTKDSDFVYLLERLGPPPQVIWLTCGNTSNAHLRTILAIALPRALTQIGTGEPLVEIGDRW
jgi:predicted nuclease of predicted toxin-antitoxin system